MEELIPTHRDNNGNILVGGRDLHKFVGVTERYSSWFERMLKYGFTENLDFTGVKSFTAVNNGAKQEIQDHAMTIDMAKEISMLQRNEKGKQARKYFIAIENKYKQSQLDTTNLSPELQMFNGLFKALAKNELATKQLDSKVDSISEIVAVSTKDWKNETNHLINKIARQQGNTGDAHRTVRTDIYADVDRRGGVSLNIRLTNLKRRMALEGASKTKLSKVNRVDVISQDKKLIEIYMAIVKEFAIKSGVWKDQY